MNTKLLSVYTELDNWCNRNGEMYDIVCDERDVQAVMLYKPDSRKLKSLVEYIRQSAIDNGVYIGVRKVRGGSVIALSVDALSEQQIESIGERTMDQDQRLSARLNTLFSELPLKVKPTPRKPMSIESELEKSAKQMYESQHKTPTNTLERSNASGQRSRSSISRRPGKRNTSDSTVQSTNEPSQSTNKPSTGATKGLSKESFDGKISSILEFEQPGEYQPSLDGLGSEYQPNDIFQRFAKALDFLGRQMAIGPIQGLLKRQGINWKKSEDGQAIIFFVTNAATNAPQPVARVGYQTLTKPQEFQKQLLAMVDFARGQAPGTEQQKYEDAQQAQKSVREVANQFAPQDPSKQQNQNGGQVMQPVSGIDPNLAPKPPVAKPGIGAANPKLAATAKPTQPTSTELKKPIVK